MSLGKAAASWFCAPGLFQAFNTAGNRRRSPESAWPLPTPPLSKLLNLCVPQFPPR